LGEGKALLRVNESYKCWKEENKEYMPFSAFCYSGIEVEELPCLS